MQEIMLIQFCITIVLFIWETDSSEANRLWDNISVTSEGVNREVLNKWIILIEVKGLSTF